MLSNAAFARLSPWLATRSLWALGAAVFALSMPFLGAGVFVVVALASEGTRLPRRYALNLVGSAAGALAPLALLGPLSAGQMLGALALTLFAAAMVLAASGMPRGTIISAAVTLALGVGACGAPDSVFPISADPTGQVAHLERIARGAGIRGRFVLRVQQCWPRVSPIAKGSPAPKNTQSTIAAALACHALDRAYYPASALRFSASFIAVYAGSIAARMRRQKS